MAGYRQALQDRATGQGYRTGLQGYMTGYRAGLQGYRAGY